MECEKTFRVTEDEFFELIVPLVNNGAIRTSIRTGESAFLLGANGSGKSSLMQKIFSRHYANARRISAHRQTWFSSNAVTLSPEQKRNTVSNIMSRDADVDSRWRDDYASQRASIAIYNLLDAENIRARQIASAIDSGNAELAFSRSKEKAPIKILNELMRLSNMPIQISVENDQVLARRPGSDAYSVAELSDGERNALLLAAEVLTVPQNTLVLIDEPERHLHRSIISPLLTQLIEERSDCAFVISTHDVALPLDSPAARTILLRSCTYAGKQVAFWDADLVPSGIHFDERLRRDILGARRTLIFVEGEEHSLDTQLYSLLFPDVSVISRGSCRDVEHAVVGLKSSEEFHQLKVFGVVDNDRRVESDVLRLKDNDIYALSVFSVESLYYHPVIQKMVVDRHSPVTGENSDEQLQAARKAALHVMALNKKRMGERAVERVIREKLEKQWPRQTDIAAGKEFSVQLNLSELVSSEIKELEALMLAGEVAAIISRYPVRETSLLNDIAKSLGFQTRKQYESAVRKLVLDEPNALVFLRSQFQGLYEAITKK